MEVQKTRKIPVILDTDIGDDIDDTWALAMLLNSPELDLKLVVTEEGNTPSRAKIAARLLEIAGRTDVPVGIIPAGTGTFAMASRRVEITGNTYENNQSVDIAIISGLVVDPDTTVWELETSGLVGSWDDLGLLPSAIEEMVRYTTPSPAKARAPISRSSPPTPTLSG